jgi:hypothetical protein
MLQLIVVDLGPELFVIANKNGMFNTRKECCKYMRLKNFPSLFAYHNFCSHPPEHFDVSRQTCGCYSDDVCLPKAPKVQFLMALIQRRFRIVVSVKVAN